MSTMIQMAAFLAKRIPKLKNGVRGRRKRENFLMWLAWNTSRGNACAVEVDGKLISVGVARSIQKETDSRLPYCNDEQGKILYVEHVAAKTKEGFLTLLTYVKGRWPQCEKIMFHRSKSQSQNKVYDMKIFMRKAFL